MRTWCSTWNCSVSVDADTYNRMSLQAGTISVHLSLFTHWMSTWICSVSVDVCVRTRGRAGFLAFSQLMRAYGRSGWKNVLLCYGSGEMFYGLYHVVRLYALYFSVFVLRYFICGSRVNINSLPFICWQTTFLLKCCTIKPFALSIICRHLPREITTIFYDVKLHINYHTTHFHSPP